MNEIITAIITGGLALLGTAIGTASGIRANQKITDYKIDELTRAVREHNNFARRIPVVEEQIKVLNHRMTDAENDIKKIKRNEESI